MSLEASALDAASCSTLIDVIRVQAARRPDRTAYIFLGDGETEEARITFAELETAARSVAVTLTREHGGSILGKRALLLFPPGLDFIVAFLGCLFAGAIPVPVVPPRNARSAPKCAAIAVDSGAALVLTKSDLIDNYRHWIPDENGATWHATDAMSRDAAEHWTAPAIDANAIAFLQYTSGSTGTPKGVIVSHGNIVANQRAICAGFAHSEESVFVGWLPLFHDMGLIGNVLQPLFLGILSVLLPPLAFLQKPSRWLSAISRYRATTSGAPNFAYDLCVAQIPEKQLAELDLSSWDVAYNGAEPVRADTLERFTRRFAPCGFRKEAFYPCYGLAEATLFVTGGPKGTPGSILVDPQGIEQGIVSVVAEGTARARPLVRCGKTWEEQRVEIVNPESCAPCEEGRVGEIWLAGPSVTQGYWQRPEETARAFGALLRGSDLRYLRTGDLGFIRDGQLHVTGRLKDLIIIRGRNHYPHDIELTVERAHPALAASGGAAFSADIEGEERLVIAHEVDFSHRHSVDREAIERSIRKAIAHEHELSVGAIRLLTPRSIAKTSSGKIRRRTCRDMFLKGTLDEFADSNRSAKTVLETANETGHPHQTSHQASPASGDPSP